MTGRAARHVARLAAVVLVLLSSVRPVVGQELAMPSSLRYGSGLLDVPLASVLPHMAVVGTYSGFRVSVDRVIVLDRDGREVGRGDPFARWMSDASIAVGLFDRVEVGATVQHLASDENGGNMLGGFARVSLLPATVDRIDLAVGARYVSSPTYADALGLEGLRPGRLGHPDYRLAGELGAYPGDFSTNLSPYVVATARAVHSGNFVLGLTAGWGMGIFSEGEDRPFYADATSGGIFGGAALHRTLGGGRVLHAMAEFNGFDVNAGIQIDLGGIRAGAFSLGLLHDGHSTYRSRKFGVMGSVALCGGRLGSCGGGMEPPPPLPGPAPGELARLRLDSTMRARSEEEGRLDAEHERGERERAHRAAGERRILEEKVFFDHDRFAIREDAAAVLRRKADILRARPGVRMRIETHADDRGSPEYNLRLGRNRGDAVVAFLVESGVEASRLTVVSLGERRPLVQGSGEEAWARNRRAEFIITAGENELGRRRP